MTPSVVFHIYHVHLSHFSATIEFLLHAHTMQIALSVHFLLSHRFPGEILHFINITELKKISENYETLKIFERTELS